MALSRSDQKRIMREDAKRRNAREIAEWIEAHGHAPTQAREGCDPYHVSRGITGEPNEHNRVMRATEDSWNRGLRMTRTVGTADNATRSVRVIHNDGAEKIVPASSFGRPRRSAGTRRRQSATQQINTTQQNVQPIHASTIVTSARDAQAIADGTA